MSKTRRAAVKVKEENEIQSYINSFKEIEEEDVPSTSTDTKKVFLSSDQIESEEYEQIIVREDQADDDEFKYVFIVQDEEDAGEEKPGDEDGEIYEFDEYEEDAAPEVDDKTKIVKVISTATKKPAQTQGSSTTHMCSYCNYSTPKRYLLARHMKCHSEDR